MVFSESLFLLNLLTNLQTGETILIFDPSLHDFHVIGAGSGNCLLPGITGKRPPTYIAQTKFPIPVLTLQKTVIMCNDRRESIFFLLFSDTDHA